MKYAVFGAGLMGSAAVFSLLKEESTEKVFVFDVSRRALNKLSNRLSDSRIICCGSELPFALQAHKDLLYECDAMLSTVPYSNNLYLANLAIETKTSMNDLGGNNTVVQEQFKLSKLAEDVGITVVPDTGLTPGLSSLLTALAIKNLDEVENVNIRVGGLPQEPKGVLNYALVFSVNGLINEYVEPVEVLRNGKKKVVEPLTELEEISFYLNGEKKSFEAFMTSGGTSTMPRTLEGKVQNLDCKTIRYKGHCKYFKALYDLGLLSKPKVRLEIEKHLEDILPKGEKDMILMRVTAEGYRNGKKAAVSYEMVDFYDEKSGFSAMQRTTAFTAAEITKMLAFGEIGEKGVIEQELYVPADLVLERLRRKYDIKIYVRIS
ncbi:hypothetical protein DRO91_06595 [Candidatus Heimdallarchaeota archaeon]|nr:MAG: hypothetical protein DRO91_06595 [Candidatus Heimdallarchaeota archaeon]